MDVLPEVLLLIAGAPLALACAYLLGLTVLSGLPQPPPRSARRLRFDILVPAHDEVVVLGRLLESLARLDWPRDQFRILVVADNCTDATATLARDAGAVVIERDDKEHWGKGYALLAGFAASREAGFADAVVVVDADSELSLNFLEACAVRIERGAQ
ncbi:MAG TPA: glycosyltransferase, partial [Nevskiaceae bacterium]|nr:glycosyltransferase [Nevskiaceae bacterium]